MNAKFHCGSSPPTGKYDCTNLKVLYVQTRNTVKDPWFRAETQHGSSLPWATVAVKLPTMIAAVYVPTPEDGAWD